MDKKVSIRFFNDREVRAVWDEASNKWLFSVIDIVAVYEMKIIMKKTATTGNISKQN